MPRMTRPASMTHVAHAQTALEHLREARDLLAAASCPRALAKTRLAITSTEGAIRHAQNVRSRARAGQEV